MKLQRQNFLLSYFKILSVDPAGVRTRDLPHDSPMLNQLSHRCAVAILKQPWCILKQPVVIGLRLLVNSWLLEVKHSFTCWIKGLDCKEAVVLCRWENEIKKRGLSSELIW